MEDEKIIDLYWERNERAITCTEEKYGAYLKRIAKNILRDEQDCGECLNDTWLRAWNAMPTERPKILSAFLGAITRNLSLDRYRKNRSAKRGGGEPAYIFDELRDCVSGEEPETAVDTAELAASIDRFLGTLRRENRMIFVRRYWYMDSIADIAGRFGISESSVKSSLFRVRNRFREHLAREGIEV